MILTKALDNIASHLLWCVVQNSRIVLCCETAAYAISIEDDQVSGLQPGGLQPGGAHILAQDAIL